MSKLLVITLPSENIRDMSKIPYRFELMDFNNDTPFGVLFKMPGNMEIKPGDHFLITYDFIKGYAPLLKEIKEAEDE